jgi:hypothetical protein
MSPHWLWLLTGRSILFLFKGHNQKDSL